MIRTAVSLAALSLCTLASDAIADDVSVAGLRIAGPGYGASNFGAELRPFNWTAGTTISIMVSRPNGGLIDFDNGESVVTSLTDSTGKKLNVGESRFGQPPARFSMGSVSKDGKAGLIDLEANGVPASGAKSIRAKGTVVVLTGTRQEVQKSKRIDLKKGTKFSVGKLNFEVTAVGKPQFGNEPLAVTLQTKQPVDAVSEWKLLKSDGSEVKIRDGATMSMGFGGRVTVDKEIILNEKVDSAVVALKVWTDRQEVKLPFDVEVGVGL